MESFDKIVELIAGAQGDVEKARNGNKRACVRVRAALQNIRDLAKDARKEALDLRKA